MAWNGLKTWTPGDPLLAQQLIDYINANLAYLLTPDQFQLISNAVLTTTSTSYVNVTAGASLSLVTYGGRVLIWFQGQLSITGVGANLVELVVTIDGVDTLVSRVRTQGMVSGTLLLNSVTAGTHTIALRWKVSAGTATLRGDDSVGDPRPPIIFGGDRNLTVELTYTKSVAPGALTEELATALGDTLESVSVEGDAVTVYLRDDATTEQEDAAGVVVGDHVASETDDEKRATNSEQARDDLLSADFGTVVDAVSGVSDAGLKALLYQMVTLIYQSAAAQGLIADSLPDLS